MSTKKTSRKQKKSTAKSSAENIPLQVTPPEMWDLEFVRKQRRLPEPDTDFEVNLSLSLSRVAENELIVRLQLKSEENPFVAFMLANKAGFRLGKGEDDTVDYDDAFKGVLTNVAVTYLFPFIREALATASTRAGMNPLLLPIMNFRHELNLNDVEIPKYVPKESTKEEDDELLPDALEEVD